MNSVILTGRLTRDPRTTYSQGAEQTAITRFTLAVNRRFAKEGEPTADFIECVSFGRQAEHASRYYKQGTKIEVRGRIQTGSYTNKDGQTVYTTDVVADREEFLEWGDRPQGQTSGMSQMAGGFDDAPAGFSAIDEDIPF